VSSFQLFLPLKKDKTDCDHNGANNGKTDEYAQFDLDYPSVSFRKHFLAFRIASAGSAMRSTIDSHAITKGEEREGKREMKTGMNQSGIRQVRRPLHTTFSGQNHPLKLLISNAVRPNPAQSGLKNKTPFAPPPLAPVSFFPICVHLRSSGVENLQKTKITKRTHFGFSISPSNKTDFQLSNPTPMKNEPIQPNARRIQALPRSAGPRPGTLFAWDRSAAL